MRRILVALGLAATCASCRGVAPPIGQHRDVAPERGGTLEMANFTDVRDLDPAIAFNVASTPLLQLLFAPLVDYDRQGRIALFEEVTEQTPAAQRRDERTQSD